MELNLQDSIEQTMVLLGGSTEGYELAIIPTTFAGHPVHVIVAQAKVEITHGGQTIPAGAMAPLAILVNDAMVDDLASPEGEVEVATLMSEGGPRVYGGYEIIRGTDLDAELRDLLGGE